MWKLYRIHATNIASYQEVTFEPEQDVATVVYGNNMDNPGQPSNGSGKSALLEMIAIGLTGEPLRKVNAEGIINDLYNSAKIDIQLENNVGKHVLNVSRTLNRKSSQEITCELDANPVVQASISDYNKYILDLIGLTKDEIYNNYILTEEHYKSFLLASDRDKKDIINRFSNGILVDGAIESLSADIEEAERNVEEASLKVSKCSGSIEAVKEEIEKAKENAASSALSKEKNIEILNGRISDKEACIKNDKSLVSSRETSLNDLNYFKEEIKKYDELAPGLTEGYEHLSKLMSEKGHTLTNYVDEVKETREHLAAVNKKIKVLETEKAFVVLSYEDNKKLASDKQAEIVEYSGTNCTDYNNYKKEIPELENKIKSDRIELDNLEKEISSNNKLIYSIDAKLGGAVVCPHCNTKFMANAEESIDSLSEKKEEYTKRVSELTEKKTKLIKKYERRMKEMFADRDYVETYDRDIRELNDELSSLFKKVDDAVAEKNKIQEKIYDAAAEKKELEKDIVNAIDDMFSEVYGFIDSDITETKNNIQQLKNAITVNEGMIATYNKSIKELEENKIDSMEDQLNKSLESYTSQIEKLNKDYDKKNADLLELQSQNRRFVEFKTYLANTKIEALGRITNDFLEQIGSDTRIKYSGYTVLKSGKVRDKISISLMRDGMDCGSIFKFSKGERARVNLANILAMHKLTNVSCDDGKGLDLLILDEVLDGTDEGGLNSIMNALNSLGITSLVVSHGKISENYPNKLLINKQNGISYI